MIFLTGSTQDNKRFALPFFPDVYRQLFQILIKPVKTVGIQVRPARKNSGSPVKIIGKSRNVSVQDQFFPFVFGFIFYEKTAEFT